MKNLSCLEADILINIFLLQGSSEEALMSDYLTNLFDLPTCCFDTSTVLRKCKKANQRMEDTDYSENHVEMIIRYVLIQLMNKGLIQKKDNEYIAKISYEDVFRLLKDKANHCLHYRHYVKVAFDYLEQEEKDFIFNESGNGCEKSEVTAVESTCQEEPLIIRQTIINQDDEREALKMLDYLKSISILTMRSNKGVRRSFLPVFATVVQNQLYLLACPNFKSEFGSNTALVFKRNEDYTFKILTDSESTDEIFRLYYAAKERKTNES